LVAGPVKWTERWVVRAQRKADLRAERFLRHEEGVRAGNEQPRFLERLEPHMPYQRVLRPGSARPSFDSDSHEASMRLAIAWLTWVRNGPICGPDGVEVAIWVRSSGQDLPRHHTPDSQNDYTVCLRRMPVGKVESIRSFRTDRSARWYAVELARQVRHVGITEMQPANILPAGYIPSPGIDDLLVEGIFGVGISLGRGIAWLPRHARARWRQARTGRRHLQRHQQSPPCCARECGSRDSRWLDGW
jgi:hypothetical protein